MKVQNLIVGSGIAGITLARRLADEQNQTVLIVERRNHIGGYCYDYRDDEGILIHKYGPHIFRTDSKRVWEYLSRFTHWYNYQHKVLTYVEGKLYPIPINLDTVNNFLGTNFDSDSVLEYFERVKLKKGSCENVKDVIESQVGPLFYQHFFQNYTSKQWGIAPEDLPKEIVARIPIRNNRDGRYFTARYQGIPEQGYTEMFMKMLQHTKIRVMLNTDYQDIQAEIGCDRLFYSGAIDEYYQYCRGRLPYRCVSFELNRINARHYQQAAVVNYPNDYDFTRITEFKYFTNHQAPHTVIAKEYSSSEGDPSYPIPVKENMELYNQYLKLARNGSPVFVGRLGRYKYYSMDEIIEAILDMRL
jgi:UDP-galactopyranose mutase